MKSSFKLGLLISGFVILLGFSGVIYYKLATPMMTKTKIILGYYTFDEPGDQYSYYSLNRFRSYVNRISAGPFIVTSTGAIEGAMPSRGLQLAKSKNIKVFTTITNFANGNFDPNLAHRILTNSSLRQTTISNIVKLVQGNDYQGVDFDFENMLPEDRLYYTEFVNELENRLHSMGRKLIVSVPAKTEDSPTSSWVGTFDYAALGRIVDKVQIMTYDEHDPSGGPGPIASYSWVKNVTKYAVSQIPPDKILLGLAAYGYEWEIGKESGGNVVSWNDVPLMLKTYQTRPKWDAASSSPFFTYIKGDGSHHVVWYENTDSIKSKVKLVSRYKLGGVAVWSMGQEDELFWKAACNPS